MSIDQTRRRLVLAAAASTLNVRFSAGADTIVRPLGKQQIPAIGMGTWLTFDVREDSAAEQARHEVLDAFFAHGGQLIDSSPMYGNAERIVGRGLAVLTRPPVIAASKIWKLSAGDGPAAFEASRQLWRIPRFELMQIHNMLTWEKHLDTLLRLQDEEQVQYIGITTSHGRRHRALVKVMRERPEFDAVQFTYNVTHREAERQLLPTAAERGLAVLINRPLDGGRLPAKLANTPLPGFARELACTSWAQLCLKFVISHPAVTCAIPATRRVDHMIENMAAMRGPLPDQALRERIAQAVTSA